MKKLIGLLIMALLVLFGCSSSNTESETANELNIFGWSATVDEEEQAMFEEHMSEVLGVPVHVTVPTDDYEKQLSMAMSGSENYDLIYFTQKDYLNFVEQGALLDISSYIEESETLSNPEILDPTKYVEPLTVDGGVYALPTKDEGGFVANVRQDWLDEWNMEVPNTLEEWEAYWEMCVTEKGAYGLSLWSLNNIQTWMNAFGLVEGVVDNGDGTYTVPYASDDAVAAWQWWQDMYAAGYIDPNFETMTETDARNAYMAGTSGSTTYYSHWSGKFIDRVQADDTNPAQDTFMSTPVASVPDEEGDIVVSNADLSLVGIPANADSPELAIEFMEYWYSPEGCMLGTFGYEGHDYTIDENGEIVLTDVGVEHQLNHAAADPVNTTWEKPQGYDTANYPTKQEGMAIAAEHGVPVAKPANWKDINDIIVKYGSQCMKGTITAEEAVNSMQTEIMAIDSSYVF